MSYDIQLFHIQTMHNFKKSQDDEFFEHIENLELFSNQQFEDLKARLFSYDYEILHTKGDDIHFRKADDDSSVSAYLTRHGLYLTASFNQDDIFEISMTASEFTDTGEFAKFDPQEGEWEA